jgi:hypothetical protein
VKARQELVREKFSGLGASGEYIVDDVIILGCIGGRLCLLDEFHGVFDNRDVVGRKVEILSGELVHDRVYFDDSSFNAVFDERRRCCANPKSTASC